MFIFVQGRDVSGTTEYIYYNNGGVYTLLGSTNNTNAATTAQTGASVQLASYGLLFSFRMIWIQQILSFTIKRGQFRRLEVTLR